VVHLSMQAAISSACVEEQSARTVAFPENRSTERWATGPRSKGLNSCKPRNNRNESPPSFSGGLILFPRGLAEQTPVQTRIAEKSRSESDMALRWHRYPSSRARLRGLLHLPHICTINYRYATIWEGLYIERGMRPSRPWLN
jgi:hypothetical protein